jgi:hypothetical protein
VRLLAAVALIGAAAFGPGVESSGGAVAVNLTHEVAAPPAKVWAVVADPGLAMLVPKFVERVDVKGSGVGLERTLHLPGGAGAVKERITARDDAAMTYTYAIVDFGPVPWTECTGTWSVRAMANGKSLVTYSARIVPRNAATKAEAKNISERNQAAVFAQLDQLFR